jgi:NAD(P)-dependent dehydrogenase (short-subunit alcohol dehydrogenase family)
MAAMNVASRAGLAQNALSGRVALVTGAASGIGWATARLLVDLGAAVVALDREASALLARCQAAPDVDGRRLHQVVFDLADLDGIDALVERVTAEHGQVTILVNAAGIIGKTILTTSLKEWEQVLAIDLTAPFLLTKAVGRRMAEHGHGGSIVNVGSSSAYRAVSSGAAYGAAKAGLGSLTRSAAWEFGPYGVNANLVAPGVTRTAITEAAFGGADGMAAAVRDGPLANLLRRVSEPEDVAAVIGFLCLPGARQITGQVVHTSAGAIVAAG